MKKVYTEYDDGIKVYTDELESALLYHGSANYFIDGDHFDHEIFQALHHIVKAVCNDKDPAKESEALIKVIEKAVDYFSNKIAKRKK